MKKRLIQKQIQESPPTTETNQWTVVIAALLGSITATVQPVSAIQAWTLIAAFAALVTFYLYLANATYALTERCVDAMMEAKTAKDIDYQRTPQTALVQDHHGTSANISLVKKGSDLLILDQSPMVQLSCFFAGLLVVLALTVVTFGEHVLDMGSTLGLSAEIKTATLIMGAVLVGLLINHLRQPMRRVVFDGSRRVFWLEHYLLFGLRMKSSAHMPIHQIIALQRVMHKREGTRFREVLFGTPQESVGQELNVVFANGERVNIAFHYECQNLKKDAVILSNFLNVPVWVARQTL